jgi:BirA family biotin operon repressor/biotin-[acetyl-CoA-carboxylase] ligase
MQLELELADTFPLPFLAAVALGDALANLGVDMSSIRYKWPNDIMLNGCKVSGILLENIIEPGSTKVKWVVLGLGLNIVDFPLNTTYPATSLYHNHYTHITSDMLLDAFMHNFSKLIKIMAKGTFKQIKHKWMNSAYKLGEVITAAYGNNRVSGVFTGITDKGCMQLLLAGGQEHSIPAGEVLYS